MNSFVDLKKVYVILGSACNFKCRYCLQAGNPPVHLSKKPSDKVISYLQMLADRQPRTGGVRQKLRVNLFGGEPLLYWQAIQSLVDRTQADNLAWSITTNGSLMNEQIAAWCNAHSVRVLLSYDGANTKCTRGVDVLDDPKAVALFKSIRHFGIETVVSAYNQDLYALVDRMRSIFGFRVKFTPTFLTINREMPPDVIDYDLTAWETTCARMANAAFEQIVSPDVERRRWEYRLYSQYIRQYIESMNGSTASTCGLGADNFYLDLEGGVWFCNNAIEQIGTVDDDLEDLNEAWESVHSRLVETNKKKCACCRWMPLCRGKCPLERPGEQLDQQCAFLGIFFSSVVAVLKRLEQV